MPENSIGLPGRHRPSSMAEYTVAAWIRNPTLLLLLVAILLPNTLFLGAILAGIGTPPRPAAILAYLAVAVIARVFGRAAGVTAFLLALVYDAINTVSLLFGLSFLEIAATLVYAREVQLFRSPLYIALGTGIVLTSALVLWLLVSRHVRLRRARLLPALIVTLAVVAVDYAFNTSHHYRFGSALAASQPFDSATRASGFEAAALGPAKSNLLIVIVEGMGQFADAGHQAILTKPFNSPALLQRYRVTRGETAYFGSTTAAEMRELCATRDPYATKLESATDTSGVQSDCMPAQLARRGYRTVGVHGFTGDMFDRTTWWPRIGLQKPVFGEELAPPLPVCGAVFKGACDTAIADRVGEWLGGPPGSRFVYWLTLNTHIPVIPGEHSGQIACEDGGPFGVETVCHMVAMWRDVFDRVIDLALDPALGPTEILVVGDHAPPLWSRRDRALFEPGKVSWIRLAVKDRPVASAPATLERSVP